MKHFRKQKLLPAMKMKCKKKKKHNKKVEKEEKEGTMVNWTFNF